MTHLHIRPAEVSRDIAAVQKFYSVLLGEPTEADFVRQVIDKATVCVAEVDDKVVGFYVISRRNTMPPEQAFVWASVAASHRRQGIGSQLVRHALEQAAEQGYTELISRVDDDNAAALAVCANFGFALHRHMLNLALDLAVWDEATLQPALAHAQAAGIRFLTLAQAGNTPEHRRRVYKLNRQLSADIPIDEPEDFPDFESYAQRRLTGDTFPHEGIFIAEHGETWVGMTQISLHGEYGFVEMTGVLSSHRGLGIAQAFKLLGARFARQHGCQRLRTVNDVGNSAMLAVNRKAGFEKESGFWFVQRPSPATAEHWVANDKLQLHLLTSAVETAKTPLFFVPGSLGHAGHYTGEFGAFPERTCVAVSLRGRGQSDAPETGYTLSHHVSDISAVAGSLPSPRYCFLAFSMGVPYALAYALENPERVAGLVLVDYPARYPAISPEWAEQVVADPAYRQYERSVRGIQRESHHVDLWARLVEIDAPVLVMQGNQQHGGMLSDEQAQRYLDALPNAQLVTFPEAGHAVWEADYERFIETIHNLVTDIDRAES